MTTWRTIERRAFLKSVLGGTTWVAIGGLSACVSPYADAGEGPAFEAWDFPGDERRPEWLALRAAVLAANPHNTQPWLFGVSPRSIDVFADLRRSLGAMDSLGRELHIGLGCAVENAVLAARAAGRAATVRWLPTPEDPTHVARLELVEAAPDLTALSRAIPRRGMNRFPYADIPVPGPVLDGMRALVDDARVSLELITDPKGRARMREDAIAATRAITKDREMAEASHRWYRQTRAEIEKHRDGPNIDQLGLDATFRGLASLSSEVDLDTANSYWISATEGRQTTGAGYFVLATQERDDREQQLVTGRIFQRLHLYLTASGVDAQLLNMLPEMQDREQSAERAERPFTARASRWLGDDGRGIQLVGRFGYAWERAPHSPRRALEEVAS